MQAERVSVVITNYNYGHFVSEAIESALAQEPRPEVVVVDDGSTDGSREVIARYGDAILAVLQPNEGMAGAMNAGLAASSGEAVLFLDGDDALLPSALGRGLNALHDTAATCARWPLAVVDRSGRPTGDVIPEQLGGGASHFLEEVIREGPLAVRTVPTSGNLWSREFLDQAMPIDPQAFPRHCDAYLTTCASVSGPVFTFGDEPLGIYRVHGDNDYAASTRSHRAVRDLELYLRRCELLAALTDAPSSRRWQAGNPHFEWLRGLCEACDQLAAVLPRDARYVLIDQDEWAAGQQLLPGRCNRPFPQRDGAYWGLPADDSAAIEELDAARAEGCSHVVVAQPALWWLDHYEALAHALAECCSVVHRSDTVLVHAVL